MVGERVSPPARLSVYEKPKFIVSYGILSMQMNEIRNRWWIFNFLDFMCLEKSWLFFWKIRIMNRTYIFSDTIFLELFNSSWSLLTSLSTWDHPFSLTAEYQESHSHRLGSSFDYLGQCENKSYKLLNKVTLLAVGRKRTHKCPRNERTSHRTIEDSRLIGKWLYYNNMWELYSFRNIL